MKFTRRCTSPCPSKFTWLVIIGGQELREELVDAATPDENFIRRLLKLAPGVPILVGRP